MWLLVFLDRLSRRRPSERLALQYSTVKRRGRRSRRSRIIPETPSKFPMTLKVERETILQLIRPGSHIGKGYEKSSYISKVPQEKFLSEDSAAVPIEFGDDLLVNDVDSNRSNPAMLPPELIDTDDDCTSTSSGSNDSCPSDTLKPIRRVSFSWPLVTEVRSRPNTLVEDLAALFYSVEDTQRFRRQYRLERQNSKNAFGVQDTENKETVKLKESARDGNEPFIPPESSTAQTKSSRLRQCISRVVVMHNNIRDIFVHADHAHANPRANQDGEVKFVNSSEHFFDNDSFWNGSLTWFDHASNPAENKR